MKLQLTDSSKIGSNDLALFVPDLNGMNETVYLSGKFRGTVNDLNGSKISLKYRDNTEFNGDLSLTEVTDPDQLFIHCDIKSLTTSYSDLSKLQLPGADPDQMANSLSSLIPLGKMSYKGKIDGFLSDIAAKGTFKTAIGSVSTDIGVSNIAVEDKKLSYHGKVKTNSFHLGRMLRVKELGAITANLTLDGEGTTMKDLRAVIKGQVNALTYNNYNYQNLSLAGEFKDKKFTGNFELHDQNADLDFYGTINFNDKYPDMDFIATVNKLELNQLHFINTKDTTNSISSQIAITVKGNNIDNLTGRINFDNTIYQLNSKQYKLSTFDLILEQDSIEKSIKLNSNIAEVRVAGRFNITELPNCFRQYLEKYFPTMITEKKIPSGVKYKDRFTYRVKVKKFSIINELILPQLMIANGTILEGEFNAAASELSLSGNSSLIEYQKYQLRNWFITANSLTRSIEINTGVERAMLSDSLYVGNFRLSAQSFDSKSSFQISWDNKTKLKYAGNLDGDINFSNKQVDVQMKKVEVFIADSMWALADTISHIKMDTSGIVTLKGLKFINRSQQINIDGVISKNPNDDVELELVDFRLGQLNPIIKSAQLKMQGSITGKATISGVLDKVIFASNFDFKNLFLNDKMLGVGKIKTIYDQTKDIVSLEGYFTRNSQLGSIKDIDFTGYYYPSKKENNIDVEATMRGLDITMIQPYVKGIITFAPARGGAIEGKVFVKGSVAKPEITGRLNLLNVKNLKIDYLNTYYQAVGVINIYPDRIQLGDDNNNDPVHLYDKDGHEATVWGNIFHDNFKVTKLDFDINAKSFMVLNTSQAQNESYFGKAFVSGNVGIYGNLDYMNMDINLKTEKNTEFNIPLSGPATVSDNDFIIFVQKDTTKQEQNVYNQALSGINLNFNLEATPNAIVRLIFDGKSGDVIQAQGNGNIKMAINTSGKFEMYGLYTLTDGSYQFSLENIISKKFDIVSGSSIKWSGDPLNADINITAEYNQSSSLAPFFPSDSTGLYSKPVRASVLLNMRDKLLTPEISFGVQLPTVDETTRQTVLSYINNEQELNRQVFSLLLLKSFVTPLQLSNQGVGVGAGAAAGRTSSEMLSNQLSNWLSQLSTNVDISVNITPEQMEVALSKQLFNDRLSIDGNVGVNNSSGQKTSNMIGDIQVEYKVYTDGKFRVKGFNKSNDNTQISTLGGPFTQGMGIFYREEFNTIDELYEKYLGWLSKKKDATNTNP